MNPARKIDKRANQIGNKETAIATYGNDLLAGYEFLQTQKNQIENGERDMLLALWKEGVEEYLTGKALEGRRDLDGRDPDVEQWVLDGNIGETAICTFNWIAINLLHCDPDKIRAKLVDLKRQKVRKLYMQFGFRQWKEGKKAGFSPR